MDSKKRFSELRTEKEKRLEELTELKKTKIELRKTLTTFLISRELKEKGERLFITINKRIKYLETSNIKYGKNNGK